MSVQPTVLTAGTTVTGLAGHTGNDLRASRDDGLRSVAIGTDGIRHQVRLADPQGVRIFFRISSEQHQPLIGRLKMDRLHPGCDFRRMAFLAVPSSDAHNLRRILPPPLIDDRFAGCVFTGFGLGFQIQEYDGKHECTS